MALHPTYAISVCSGYGGIDLGLRLALGGNCRTVLYCEREAFSAAILVAQMEAGNLDEAPVWSDLTTIPALEIIERLGVRNEDVILHGGIPCQPWSSAGQRRGADDERWLWTAFWRVVEESGLGWIFLENVRGFVSGADPGIEHVLRDLSRAGWDAEWDLFSAAECGAPHQRERLFLLAHAPEVGRGEIGAKLTGRNRLSAPVGGRHVGDAERPIGRAGSAGRRDMERQGGVHPGRNKAPGGSGESGIEVADADGRGQSGTRIPERSGAKGKGASDAGRNGAGQLADAGGAGCQGGERRGAFHKGPPACGSVGKCGSAFWPAPPGEQYDWEPRRVVVYAGAEAESGVGGDIDGRPAVVDKRFGTVWAGRISALGNGVVPVVAAVAYLTLHGRLGEGSYHG